MPKKIRFIVLPLFAVILGGCFLAPAIDSFNKLGVTESDRKVLLARNLKLFKEARVWGQTEEALAFVMDENRLELGPKLRAGKDTQKIVESEISGIDFADSGYDATVEMTTKFYRIPVYIVEKRIEKQIWKFSMSDGWKLQDLQIVPETA